MSCDMGSVFDPKNLVASKCYKLATKYIYNISFTYFVGAASTIKHTHTHIQC